MEGKCRIGCLTMLILAIYALYSASAFATTYNCTAVDDKASLGISGGSVAISTSRKRCNFSVNGASVDERRAPTSHDELNSLLRGNFDSLSRTEVPLVLRLMTRPFLGTVVDSFAAGAFENDVSSHISDLGQCIRNGIDGSSNSNFDTQVLSCRVIVPPDQYSPSKSFSTGVLDVMFSERTLMIHTVFQQSDYYLFVPESLFEAGRRGFQFQ